MEFLHTAWTWFINLLSVTIKYLDPAIDWINDNRYFTAIAILLSFLAALKTFWPSKPTPEEVNKQNSLASSAENFAKAIIAANEQGKQTAEANLLQDLQARDQQIAALSKAVEAMQTERQEAETEAEQTTIDTALAHLKEGNPSEAEAIFEEILEEQSKRGQQANKQAAAAARHIGALAFLHDTDKAHKAYKRATELDPDNADGWNQLGLIQKRIGQFENAIEAYEKIITKGESSNNINLIATGLGNLGNIFKHQGNYQKAKETFLKSLEFDEKLNNKIGIAANNSNLAEIYKEEGNLEKAKDLLLRSIKIYKELGNKKYIASMLGNLGIIYNTLGNYEKAEDYQLQALQINEEFGDKLGIASNLTSLGNISLILGDLYKAEDRLIKSLKLKKELNYQKGIAESLCNLGIVHQERKNLKKAEKLQLESLSINQQLGIKRAIANNYANLGNISKLKDNMSKACTHWQKALELFTEVGAKRNIEQVSIWLKDANCPVTKKSAGG